MSRPAPPVPAKLVLSLLSSDRALLTGELPHILEHSFGPIDLLTEPIAFTETSYYDAELGTPILRRFLSLVQLVEQDRLVEMKLRTNALEQRLARGDGRRRVNIDPGWLTLERFVLATGKNNAHRIYLGRGIWADLTLLYRKSGWQALPWTFFDYAGTEVQSVLTRIRDRYKTQLQQAGLL